MRQWLRSSQQHSTQARGRTRKAFGTLGTSYGRQALGILTGVLAARLLGVEGRGALAAVILWPSVITSLGDLGLPLAYQFYSAREPDRIGRLIANALPIVFVQWFVLAVLGTPIVWLILRSYELQVLQAGLVFLHAFIPLNLITRYLNSLNQGTSAFARFNLVRISIPASYLLLLLALFIFNLQSLKWVVSALLVSNALGLAVVLLSSTRALLGPEPDVRRDKSLFGATFTYGVKAHFGNLTPVDSMRLDLLAVTALLGAHEAGLYAVAGSAAQIIRVQGISLGMALLPDIAQQRRPDHQSQTVGVYSRSAIIVITTTGVALFFLSEPLLRLLYGNEFAEATPIMKILVVAAVAAAFRKLLGDGLRGLGAPIHASAAELGSWAVAVPAMAIFVPLYGARGAAFAAALTYFTAALLCVLLLARAGLPWYKTIIPRLSDLRRLFRSPKALLPSRRAR